MTENKVTALGRLLKGNGSTPRFYKVIAVKPDGTVKPVVHRPL